MPKKERVRLYDDDDELTPQPPAESKSNRNLPIPDEDPEADGTRLSVLEEKFVHQYTGPAQYVAIKAAIRAGVRPTRAHIYAHHYLHDPRIKNRIRQIETERLRHLNIQGDIIAAHMFAIATADATELVEIKTPCCRHCYGTNYQYQRTHAEFEADFENYNRLTERKKNAVGPFDERGGDGYDEELPPNPSCPNCFGRGDRHSQYVKIKDTAYMSPMAKQLFAGVEQTKNGLRITMRDQTSATNLIMKLAEAELEQRRRERSDQPVDLTQMSLEQLEAIVAQGRELGLSEEDDFPEDHEFEPEEAEQVPVSEEEDDQV